MRNLGRRALAEGIGTFSVPAMPVVQSFVIEFLASFAFVRPANAPGAVPPGVPLGLQGPLDNA